MSKHREVSGPSFTSRRRSYSIRGNWISVIQRITLLKKLMLYGNGDNGKGVFIKLIEAFVGRENSGHSTTKSR